MGPGVNFTNLAKYKAADLGIIYGFCRAWLVTFPATYLPNSHQSMAQSSQGWRLCWSEGVTCDIQRKQLSCYYISLYVLFLCSVWVLGLFIFIIIFNWNPNVIIFVPCLLSKPTEVNIWYEARRWSQPRLCEGHTRGGKDKASLGYSELSPSTLQPSLPPSPPPCPLWNKINFKLDRETKHTSCLGTVDSSAPAPPGWDCLISRQHMPNPFTTFQIV